MICFTVEFMAVHTSKRQSVVYQLTENLGGSKHCADIPFICIVV